MANVRPGLAQGLHIASPGEGQVVRGAITFRVAVDAAALGDRLIAIIWRLNGQDQTGPLTVRPYDWRWHSTLAYDGPALIEAVALDTQGRVLARSRPVAFQVNNHGHDLRLVEPTYDRLRKEPVGGKLSLTFAAERNMTEQEKARQKEKLGQLKPIEAIVFYLDGRLVNVQFGAPRATFQVDTTKLANGEHLLRATSWAFEEGVPPLAQLQIPIRVQNDRPAEPSTEATGEASQVPSLELPGVPHFSRSGYAGTARWPVLRYRLHGATLKTERIDTTERETIEFQPGEAIVWLLRPHTVPGDARDRDPPSVRLTSPLPGATVAGEVTLSAEAADDATVSRVEFYIDGARLGERTAPPYQMQWNTASAKPETWHQLTAVACDRAGNPSEARQKVRVAGTGRQAEHAPRKIVLLAGKKSHGPGVHEYEKDVTLLKHCLDTSSSVKGLKTESHFGGWLQDVKTLDDADTIVLLSDGLDNQYPLDQHPFLKNDHMRVIERQMNRGCGLVIIHWPLWVPSQNRGEFQRWLGGRGLRHDAQPTGHDQKHMP
jgi:hypothetical protein